jgi:hypothetical protein
MTALNLKRKVLRGNRNHCNGLNNGNANKFTEVSIPTLTGGMGTKIVYLKDL